MSGSDRGAGFKIVTAILIATVFILYSLAVWHTSGKHASVGERQKHNSREYAATAEKQIENTCLLLEPVAKAKCIREIINSTNEHDRSERDLVAQTNMAFWALWMAIISAMMFVATVCGVWFVWRTLGEARATTKAAQDSINLTREIGQAQVRAYLTIDEPKFKIIENIIYIVFSVKNTGQSPSKNFALRLVTRGDTKNEAGHFSQKGFCDKTPDIAAGGNIDVTAMVAVSNENIQKTSVLNVKAIIFWDDVFGDSQMMFFGMRGPVEWGDGCGSGCLKIYETEISEKSHEDYMRENNIGVFDT